MVLPNQYLERMVVFPGPGNATLEALFHRGRLEKVPLLISAPHPAFGGSMESPVVAELAYSGYRAGNPTFRYNYRGAGASQGTMAQGTHLERESLEDLEAAIDYFSEESYEETGDKLILAGYSFGAWVSLQRALAEEDYRVWKLILIAPPVALMDFSRLAELTTPTIIIVGDTDSYSDIDQLKRWAGESEGTIKLHILPGVDHFFSAGLVEVGRLTMEFL